MKIYGVRTQLFIMLKISVKLSYDLIDILSRLWVWSLYKTYWQYDDDWFPNLQNHSTSGNSTTQILRTSEILINILKVWWFCREQWILRNTIPIQLNLVKKITVWLYIPVHILSPTSWFFWFLEFFLHSCILIHIFCLSKIRRPVVLYILVLT